MGPISSLPLRRDIQHVVGLVHDIENVETLAGANPFAGLSRFDLEWLAIGMVAARWLGKECCIGGFEVDAPAVRSL